MNSKHNLELKRLRPNPITLAVVAWLTLSVSLNERPVFGQETELTKAIQAVKAVGPDAQAHDAALAAVQVLNRATAADVPQMLQAMEGANKIALNWLRGGIQSALDNGPMPRKQITAFLADRSGSHMGRLMAFELLSEIDDTFASANVAAMIDDPGLSLRQMAVADYIQRSGSAEPAEAIGLLGFALSHCRDVKQVEQIVKLLGEQGVQVNLQKQLGVVANWHIVGPFDNVDEKGFDTAFGPEKDPANIDLAATYTDSKTGEELKWTEFNTLDSTGVVDLNELLGAEKGVLAYALTEFDAVEDCAVDIRIGCINGNKVWVNGKEILNNEIYHVGMMTDQFVASAKLKEGKNTILCKVCQNEQTEPWANLWMFQLRVCQADGKAVLPAQPVQPEQ